MFHTLFEELLDLRVTERGLPVVGSAFTATACCCCSSSCSKPKLKE